MGTTTDKHYANGYQAAMRDIYSAWSDGGYDRIIEWVFDNSTAPEHADIREHFGVIVRQNRAKASEDAEYAAEVRANGHAYGERAACKHCDADIEYVGPNPDNRDWWDRGGNFECHATASGKHEPFTERDVRREAALDDMRH